MALINHIGVFRGSRDRIKKCLDENIVYLFIGIKFKFEMYDCNAIMAKLVFFKHWDYVFKSQLRHLIFSFLP